jgi:hypothetical protein
LDRLEFNRPLKGRALSVFVESIAIDAQSRRVDTDQAAREACPQCWSFQSCCGLSLARCSVGIALSQADLSSAMDVREERVGGASQVNLTVHALGVQVGKA